MNPQSSAIFFAMSAFVSVIMPSQKHTKKEK
jgi:hypothetical protein